MKLDIASRTLLIGSVIVTTIMILVKSMPYIVAIEWNLILMPLGLSIAGTAFAYVVYYRILELAGESSLMLVTIIVPIIAILIDAIILSKWISVQTPGGFLIISLELSLI